MTKVETIKIQIENGTYDWESAINDTAEKLADIYTKKEED